MEKARAKLTAAEALLKIGQYDDAVSRAYYAAYHSASACLLTEGQKAETHRGVLTLFSLLFVKSGKIEKAFGRCLSNLKDDRETGDYEVFSTIDVETAKNALQEARDFVAAVDRYLATLS